MNREDGIELGRDEYGEVRASTPDEEGNVVLTEWDEDGRRSSVILTREMCAKLASLLSARATPSAPPVSTGDADETSGIAVRALEALRGLPAFVDVQAHGGSLYVSISDPAAARHYPGHVDGWGLKFSIRPAPPAPVSDEALVERARLLGQAQAWEMAAQDCLKWVVGNGNGFAHAAVIFGKYAQDARAAIAAMPPPASGAGLTVWQAMDQLTWRLGQVPLCDDCQGSVLGAINGTLPADASAYVPAGAPASGEPNEPRAVELLRRIVKYAREDGVQTPGSTRLHRALRSAEALLAPCPCPRHGDVRCKGSAHVAGGLCSWCTSWCRSPSSVPSAPASAPGGTAGPVEGTAHCRDCKGTGRRPCGGFCPAGTTHPCFGCKGTGGAAPLAATPATPEET